MIAGLWVWLADLEKPGWRPIILVGLLFGLAGHQELISHRLAPDLGRGVDLVNLVYYRSAPQRAFIVPGLISVACFAGFGSDPRSLFLAA